MKKKKVAIDARFVLRKQRGMPLYTFMLCKLIPKILYQHQFVLFINKGFEHNDSAEKYQDTRPNSFVILPLWRMDANLFSS